MKKLLYVFLILLLTIGCRSNPDKTKPKSENQVHAPGPIKEKSKYLNNSIINKHLVAVQKDFIIADTSTNYAKYIFQQIDEELYNKLNSVVTKTTIPIDKSCESLTKTDSCMVLKQLNGYTDTICNFTKGDYFEKYTFITDWKENNQILLSFENWEEKNDIFWSKADGTLFYLTPDYILSPEKDFILTYSNINDNPLYALNVLGITVINPIKFILDLNKDLGEYGVFEAGWVNKNKAIFHVRKTYYSKDSVPADKYFILTITK